VGVRIIFVAEFSYILVGSPCKKFTPYDNPFWDFNNGGNNKRKIPKIVSYISLLRWRTHFARTKNIKNSGLPKFFPLAHALRSDQYFDPWLYIPSIHDGLYGESQLPKLF
jgi:hypothetical protein